MSFISTLKRIFPIFILMFSLVATTQANAAITTVADAINIAGSQRMLSQRMLMEYLLILLDVKPDDYRKQLNATVTRFDQQLKALSAYASTTAQQQRFREVSDIWGSFRSLMTSTPSRVNLEEARRQSETLLRASHIAVEELERNAAGSLNVINLSGRQRMLSQRMASLYMFKALGAEASLYEQDLKQTDTEFGRALDELMGSSLNTAEISNDLKKVNAQYSLFKFSLNQKGKTFPFTIAQAAEKLLELTDSITNQYVKTASNR